MRGERASERGKNSRGQTVHTLHSQRRVFDLRVAQIHRAQNARVHYILYVVCREAGCAIDRRTYGQYSVVWCSAHTHTHTHCTLTHSAHSKSGCRVPSEADTCDMRARTFFLLTRAVKTLRVHTSECKPPDEKCQYRGRDRRFLCGCVNNVLVL